MGTGTEEGQALELVIEPRSDRYDPDDHRWRDQTSDFFAALGREVGDVRRETTAVAGTKGGLSSVILALGSAGAFTVSLDYFRAWLGRDRTRRLDISWTVDGRQETVSVTGDAIDKAALDKLAEAAARRIGGPH